MHNAQERFARVQSSLESHLQKRIKQRATEADAIIDASKKQMLFHSGRHKMMHKTAKKAEVEIAAAVSAAAAAVADEEKFRASLGEDFVFPDAFSDAPSERGHLPDRDLSAEVPSLPHLPKSIFDVPGFELEGRPRTERSLEDTNEVEMISFASKDSQPSVLTTAMPDLKTPTLTQAASSGNAATRTGIAIAVVMAGLALFSAIRQESQAASRRQDYEEMLDMDEAL